VTFQSSAFAINGRSDPTKLHFTMIATKTIRLPKRSQIKPSDTWDLSTLYSNGKAWEADLAKLEKRIKGYSKFRGTLVQSPEQLAACIKYDGDTERLADRLSNFAFLKTAEDQANSESQRLLGRYRSLATRVSEAASFIQPEIMAIPDAKMKSFLADRSLAKYRLLLERVLRFKPHTLGQSFREVNTPKVGDHGMARPETRNLNR
jgi:oligoendopeptidase F